MPYTLGISEGLDIIEGLVAGGLVGLGAFLVGGAVASLPASFLPVASVAGLSTIGGALAFVGVALEKIRSRNEP